MTTLQITFVSESAGYRNTLGYYNKRTGEVEIVFLDTNDDGKKAGVDPGDTATIDVDQADLDAGNIGFFIIPNGADIYGAGPNSRLSGPLSFEMKKNGDGQILDARGRKLTGEQGQIIFSDPALNRKDVDYTKGDDDADGVLGRIAFEDLVRKSDKDFNDLVIDVQVLNRPPKLKDQAFEVAENSAAGTVVGQVLASDPDVGQSLAYAIVGGNDDGAFVIDAATGLISVAEDAVLDFETLSAYALSVEVTDSGSEPKSSAAVVSIALGDVNEFPPVANDDVVAGTQEDGARIIPVARLLANDSDADGRPTMTIVAVGDAMNGSVELDGRLIRFSPDANYSGPASFSYTLSDGEFTDTATVFVDIEAVADEPIIEATDASSVGNGPIPLSLTVALADTDGSETLSTVTISGVPADWSLSAGVRDEETGNYTLTQAELPGLSITPAPGSVGSATLTVTATATESSNGDAATTVAALTVSVDQEGAFKGQAIDGYIVGATVFADADTDGVLDEGEASATTDALGGFTLVGGTGPLVLSGGVDISTGQAFAGVLRAPEGATVLTPLTTLVAAGLSTAQVSAAFGLDPSIDLLHFDPIPPAIAGGSAGDAAARVAAAGIQVQNAITQVSALLAGAGATNAGDAVVAALADLVDAGAPVDLADPSATEGLIVSAAAYATGDAPLDAAVITAAAQVLAATNAAANEALAGGSGIAVLESLAQVASVAQGAVLAESLAQSGAANEAGTLVDDYTGANLDALVASAPVGDVDGGIVGTLGDDTLAGGDGNDAIDGLSGNDLLSGLGGNDQLYGGPGHDTLRGGAGDDVLNGGVLADFQSFAGFTDTDRADYSGAASGVNVNLATGVAQDGDGGTDSLIGVEAVTGSAHDDMLTGSGAFFEIFRGGAGNDTIDGAGSFDRAEYQDATAGITVDLAGLAPNMSTVTGDASVGTDTLIDVEQVAGTDFADTYVATGFVSHPNPGDIESNFNSFEGRGGDDTITGNGGTRVDYFTATGAVQVDLAAGTASGDASVGNDTFTGVVQVRGSAYDDLLTGGNPSSNGFESFDGRGGDDFIDGGQGFDRAEYAFNGPALSGIHVAMAAGTVTGDAEFTGTDTIRGIESIRGTHLDDWYDATGFSPFSTNAGGLGTFNEFEGMAGDDTVTGNGNTRVSYVLARESVEVSLAAGMAVGGASVGTDTFNGGITEVRGSNFDDLITGSNHGVTFAQIFEGRGGNDIISGGGGFDVARYSSDPTHAGITVVMAALAPNRGTVTGDDAIGTDTLVDIAAVRGTRFDDTYNAVNFSAPAPGLGTFNEFEGDGGDDTIVGNGNTRISYSNAGAAVTVDLAAGTADGAATGHDTVSGVNAVRGSAFDDLLLGSVGNETFEGRAGNDAIDGRDGFDTARYDIGATAGGSFVADGDGGFSASAGGHGTDALVSIESIRGTNFADVFDGSASSLGHRFDGLNGDDALIGSEGHDTLFGGNDDDYLVGGSGNDFMDGGAGIDRADYSDATGAVSVDLAAGTAIDGVGDVDTLLNIENATGSDFSDTLAGNFADNVLDAGIGNDVLRGGGGNDALDGGIIADFQSDEGFRDDDRADYSTAFFGVTVNLAEGFAFDGEGGMDTLSGIESVIGSAQDDHFTGSDIWREVYRGGAGDDTIHGGGGFDLGDYSDAPGAVTIDLGRFDGSVDSSATVFGHGMDALLDVELFVGSGFGDTYSVGGFSSGAFPGGVFNSFNSFEGRGGDDWIFGNGNTRAEYTSATAAVRVDLGAGEASAGDGSVGFDRLFGVNQVRGSSFDDELIGTFGNETLDGRAGNDFLDGREGFDRADYGFNGPSTVGIAVELAAGLVTGDAQFTGTDELSSIEAIRGTHLADSYDATGFSGSFGALNEFEGMAGDDTVVGNGSTRLSFTLAREGVTVDLALGKVFGGDSVGTDTVGGVNAMRGSGFADVFRGTNHGITSAQVYEGRAGNDEYSGRGGFDQARYDSDPTQTGIEVEMAAINAFTGTVTGEAGVVDIDTLIDIVSVVGTQLNDSYDATGYFSDVSGLGAFNEFEGGGGDDTIVGNGATRATFLGSFSGVTVDLAAGTASGFATGNDSLENVFSVRGSNNADALRGSASDDTFEGRGGNDFINGRDGFDLVRYDNGSNSGGTFIADATGSFSASAGGHDSDTLVNVESIRGTNFGDLFVGSAAALGFEFDGRGGDDILLGSQGHDRLLGGNGNDLLRGGLGADVLDGGAGLDRLDFNSLAEAGDTVQNFQTGFGGDVIDIADLLLNETGYPGGPLSEFVQIAASGADGLLQIDADGSGVGADWLTVATLQGGAGLNADDLVANGNLDVEAAAGIIWTGTDGDDVQFGGPGNDVLMGLLGNDLLGGGAGDDVLDGGIIADLQSDVGFRDTDRVDYSAASSGVSVHLGAGLALDGEGGLDTLIGIESITGSAHADLLSGSDTTFVENFRGGAGNDVIQGGGGNDRAEYVDATSGVAILATASGSGFTAAGDASVGFDQLTGVELFNGSEHGDTFNAAAFGAFNAFEGRGGNDTITGNGNTRVEYTSAASAVTVDLATGTASDVLSSVGTDTFLGGVNQVRGSAHADTLLGGNFAFDGFEGFDGRGGNDHIDGGSGWDRADYAFNGPITTGVEIDLAAGTVSGDPTLVGMDTLRGIEAVRGSHRADTFDATGFSEFSTNAGWFGASNQFEGMAGNDTVTGNGSTTIAFGSAREGVTVNLQAGSVTGGASVGNDTLLGGIAGVSGSSFDDTIIGSSNSEGLFGGNGNDLLRGGGGFDFLDGGAGSDRFDFDSPFEGIDTISFFEAFPGGDVLDIGELLRDWTTYDSGTGAPLEDFVRLALDPATFTTELQIDTDGSAESATWLTIARMFGAEGLNVADLLANGNLDIESEVVDETVPGTPNNDFLEGGPGNDTLLGFEGNDTLRGRGGDDVLDGGIIWDLQSDAGFRDNDRADYSTALSGVTVNLQTGVAEDDGEGGTDELIGIEGVTGSAFDDTIIGADNTFSESFRGGAGNDHIDGGGGNDLAEYWDATGSLLITLGGPMGGSGGEVSGAAVGTDTLLDVERVMGSDFADSFDASGFASASTPGGFLSRFNAFEGRGGNDAITGNGATRIEFTGAMFSGVTVDLDAGEATGDASVGTDTFSGVSQVRGSRFDDTFFGSQFDDSFDGRAGNDQIDGRGGFDRADYAFNGPAAVGLMVNLAAGTVEGDSDFSGTDTLVSIEAIRGTHLADTYNALGFFGSFGTLNEFEGMAGDDTVWGNGNTRISFASAREDGIVVDLQLGTVMGGASVGNDTLMGGINQMRGSNFADTFRGTNHGTTFAEVYEGRAGDDTFEGRGGYDQARYDTDPTQAGIMVDMATAAGSNVGTVTGDLWIGTDTLIDIVAVVGTRFDDVYDGSGYNSAVSLGAFNEFEGLGGNDTITGNGSTRVTFISAWAGVTVDLAAGTASGAATGNDTLIDIFRVRGSNFNDTLLGTALDDNFEARDGNDLLVGGAGDDRLDGGLGIDRVSYAASSGGIVVDLLAGTADDGMGGTDTLLSIELMTGSAFDDSLSGTDNGITFAQIYEGRAGDDTFSGRGGFDQARYDADPTAQGIVVDMATAAVTNTGTVTGEVGVIDTDTLIDVVAVVGTAHADTYDATDYFSGVSGLGAFNEFEGLGGNDTVTGNGATRVSYISSSSFVTVNLGSVGAATGTAIGTDTLNDIFNVRGSNFADTLIGSALNDTFEGRGGFDTIDGGDGFDLVRYDNGSFGSGSFTADAMGNFDASAVGHDSDSLSNVESIRGTNFDDQFDGRASALGFTFDGRSGNDTLFGSQGNDTLVGGSGSDVLRGGLGADFMDGGLDADRFEFNNLDEAGDTIAGFEAVPGGDVLDLGVLLAFSTTYVAGGAEPLENFVQLQAAGSDALLQIDADGAGAAEGWETLATLLGHAGLDIATLQSQGNLDTLI